MPGKIHSAAQRRFFGAVASGHAKMGHKGLSAEKAKEILHAEGSKKAPKKSKKFYGGMNK